MSWLGLLGDVGAFLTAGALAWHGIRHIETMGLIPLAIMSAGGMLTIIAIVGLVVT